MTRPIIGFAGLTHLGLVSAAAAAARGFRVVAFDWDEALVGNLRSGQPHISEPGLPEILADKTFRLNFTNTASDLGECDLVYVAVDVPTDENGNSDLTPVSIMTDLAIAAIRADAVLVMLCQVPPGFTRAIDLPDNRLYYQVETLIFGRAVERAMHPERFILGCANPQRSLDPRLARFLEEFECPILPMRYESAELAKISINMCLIASVSVANTMAEICEQVGADWSEIVPSLRLDRRIGPWSYLAAGLGLSGGNLERDLATVMRLAQAHGTDGGVAAAWAANSHHRKEWAWRTLERHVLADDPGARIGVLGLAYKENTHSTKNSPSLALIAHLAGRPVRVFDPAVPVDVAGPQAVDAGSALSAADGVDVLCIMTPWPEFRALDPAAIALRMRGNVILDPYAVLDPVSARRAGLLCHRLGMAAAEGARQAC